MAEEQNKKVGRIIPERFIGIWIEKGADANEPGKITVSEKGIVWKRDGTDTVTVSSEDVTVSGKDKKLMFSSPVAVIQGKQIPVEKMDGKASVAFTFEKNDLVINVSGIKEKVKRCGAVPPKGYAGIERAIVDGKIITCIKYSPEVYKYRKLKKKK
jgi:hypothetical protein